MPGTSNGKINVRIANGATVTLRKVTINQTQPYAGITLRGSGTIRLEGENTVTGGNGLSAIFLQSGSTLTIDGTGAGYNTKCGKITITNGVAKVTATKGTEAQSMAKAAVPPSVPILTLTKTRT